MSIYTLAPSKRVEYDDLMSNMKIWGRRALITLGVMMLVAFVINLNSRIVHMFELQSELEAEESKLADMLTISTNLDAQIAYAKSDEAVEEWARQENWMRKDGDFWKINHIEDAFRL